MRERASSHVGWSPPAGISGLKKSSPFVLTILVGFRQTPGRACDTGGTTGNTASQLQLEIHPASILKDRIFVTALLASPATLHVGGFVIDKWDHEPKGGIGLYHHSVPFAGASDISSSVTVQLRRNGSPLITAGGRQGQGVSNTCPERFMNWNPIVIFGLSESTSSARPALSLSQMVCVEGTGAQNGGFRELCQFTCKYGYVRCFHPLLFPPTPRTPGVFPRRACC